MLVTQKYVNPLECRLCKYGYECFFGNKGEEFYRVGLQIKVSECKQYQERLSERRQKKLYQGD